MTPPVVNPRRTALQEITARTLRLPPAPVTNGNGQPNAISDFFGCNTFGAKQMKSKLPKAVYEKLLAAIRSDTTLDPEIAPAVAQIIREWALSRGVTHFTHWFQ